MDRRKFMTAMGAGTAIALMLPKTAFGLSKPKSPRYITLDSPGSKVIRVLKGGHQIGVLYWVDLETRRYRRVALWVDFADSPWDGGRIVRHPSQADMSKITYGPLHRADMNLTYEGSAPKGARIASGPDKETWSYPIDQYPIVDYESYHSNRGSDYTNCRSTALSVEGTFDEIMISEEAPPDILAMYPDLPRFKPKASIVFPEMNYVYDALPIPRRTEYVVTQPQTADELVEDMRRWVAGEDDHHDKIVKSYKQMALQRG